MALAAEQQQLENNYFSKFEANDYHLSTPQVISLIANNNEKPRSQTYNSFSTINTQSIYEYPDEESDTMSSMDNNNDNAQINQVIANKPELKQYPTVLNLAPASSFKKAAAKNRLSRNYTTGHIESIEETSEEFSKELTARQKAFRRLSRRKPLENDDEDRVIMGTRISEGHQNYILMYNMLTGIRIAVGRVSAKPDRPLVADDFWAAHKLAFDV